ncbi:uncharacterized protein PF11_0207-like [Maniola jurtina]|uniref:uncharacterized protein PF11_0207-like n=1 Tax=Maniola jurtina TaxID=191418 RepID=UPI001E68E4EA|nr:uncharacterized protein PF11_0207-like [Maniola jurtina]
MFLRMRKKITLILTLLLISDDVFGKSGNKTKQIKTVHKNYSSKHKVNSARVKRSLDDGTEKIFGKENIINESNQYDYLDGRGTDSKLKSVVEKQIPFWGSRGRRESSSDETVPDVQLPTPKHNKYSKNLYKLLLNSDDQSNDEVPPFWASRGRRDSDDSKDDDSPQFWASRGRRQDEEPFWASRGRRQEDNTPFWASRGRRQEDNTPFWASRGRRQEDDMPFWASRGRRQDDDTPFWASRGRRQDDDTPFWASRGRRESFEPYPGHGRNKAKLHYSYEDLLNQKTYLKNAILDAIDDLGKSNNNFERNRRKDIEAPFWMNRGRDSKLKTLFNGLSRNRMQYNPSTSNKVSANELHSKTFQQNTVHDDRIYAEEPHYILVERSSRSSAEDDPFFISRGKKYSKANFNLAKAPRGRRGALEDIMKSVRNDPYNIARGKKDYVQIGNSNSTESQFIKTKDLICASIDLLTMKHSEGNKVKREVLDNDRDRRTTLKKLALQLQMDPYFVSRGKKDGGNNIKLDDLEQFINKVMILCN